MSDFIEALQKISLIKEATEVKYTKEVSIEFNALPNGEERERLAAGRAKEVRISRIKYKSGKNQVVGFVLMPRKVNSTLPCIIYNRGGSNDFGKITNMQLFLRMSLMASWGYVVVASQYSGNDGSEGKDQHGGEDLKDVLNLYKILKEYPVADVSRIGMYGGSRGGLMTYLCLARVKWIKAAVTVAGLADIYRCMKLRPNMKTHYQDMFKTSKAELDARSPIKWVEKFHKKTPVLMMHGTADWRVSPLDSLDLSRRMIEEKIPHRLVIFEGADHGLTEFMKESTMQTRNWFDRFVMNKESLPNLKLHGD